MSYLGFFNDTAYQVVDGNIVYASDLNNPMAALETGIAGLVDAIQTGATIKTATDTGVVNAYVMSLTAAPTALVDGLEVWLKPAISNTSAATLNLNSLGAKAIRSTDRTALVGGELLAGYPFLLKYVASVDSWLIVSDPGSTALDTSKTVVGGGAVSVSTNDTQIIISAPVTPEQLDYIVDGDFNVWLEGVSQTSSGYGSDTMCSNEHSGTTKTHTRQAFTVGQTDVPGGLKYYSRSVVASVAGAGNYERKRFFVDDVRRLAGKTVTLSFYAKADAAKNIAVEFFQNFGTGGSPSVTVTGISPTLVALSTSWVKYTTTITIPSISGKTLGTDENSWTGIHFWRDAGSDHNARTANLGQQSGTFELARVRLVGGSVDGDSIDHDLGEELIRLKRYYRQSYVEGVYPGAASTASMVSNGSFAISANSTWGTVLLFDVPMRISPTVTTYHPDGTANSTRVAYGAGSSGKHTPTVALQNNSVLVYHNGTASGLSAGQAIMIEFQYKADARP